MQIKPKGARKQRGFTLVEMSVTMAAAGLLFAAVSSGQELVDQAKAAKLLNDVKTVEAQIQQYAQLKGRMPGDCDGNGIIDYAADATTARGDTSTDAGARASEYSYSVLLPTVPADGAEAAAQTDSCALVGEATESTSTETPPVTTVSMASTSASATNANVWLNDLKHAGLVSDSAPNRKLAKMVHEDFLFVGNIVDAGGAAAAGGSYNAIVIHNVPQWMARRLATAINGQDARADRSRIRLLQRAAGTTGDGTYSERWQTSQLSADTTSATRDGKVSVVYFFDRIPESKKESDTPA